MLLAQAPDLVLLGGEALDGGDAGDVGGQPRAQVAGPLPDVGIQGLGPALEKERAQHDERLPEVIGDHH